MEQDSGVRPAAACQSGEDGAGPGLSAAGGRGRGWPRDGGRGGGPGWTVYVMELLGVCGSYLVLVESCAWTF